jgi:hypothetical protein
MTFNNLDCWVNVLTFLPYTNLCKGMQLVNKAFFKLVNSSRFRYEYMNETIGDTLWTIVRRHGISLCDLFDMVMVTELFWSKLQYDDVRRRLSNILGHKVNILLLTRKCKLTCVIYMRRDKNPIVITASVAGSILTVRMNNNKIAMQAYHSNGQGHALVVNRFVHNTSIPMIMIECLCSPAIFLNWCPDTIFHYDSHPHGWSVDFRTRMMENKVFDANSPPTAEEIQWFEQDVLPIL